MTNKKTTIKDIARFAGVSDTTVSLCFKNESRISTDTKIKVLKIAQKLNYSPNTAARELRLGSTNTIGFVVSDITNPFYACMTKAAELTAMHNGFNIAFYNSDWDPKKEIDIVKNIIANRVQGILICFCEKTRESYDLINKSLIPYIAIGTLPSFFHGPYVINDLYYAGYLATQHLIDMGCRHCVFFTGNSEMDSYSAFQQLFNGFVEYHKENNVVLQNVHKINAGLTIESGNRAFQLLVSKSIIVDGIFCVNDLCAFGVMEAAEKHGIKVGRDIAIIGINNLEISELSLISLTSIQQPYGLIVQHATDALIKSIRSNTYPSIRKKLKPGLIKRNSTNFFT
jgi:LacI family transcriptional regulator